MIREVEDIIDDLIDKRYSIDKYKELVSRDTIKKYVCRGVDLFEDYKDLDDYVYTMLDNELVKAKYKKGICRLLNKK